MAKLAIVLLLCYASHIQGQNYDSPSYPAPSYKAADPAPSYNPAPSYDPAPSYNPAPAYKASSPAKDPYSKRTGLGDTIVAEDSYKEKKTTSYNKEDKDDKDKDYKKGFINDKGECMCKAPKKKNKKKTEDAGNYKSDPKSDYKVDPAPKFEYKSASPPASSYNSYNPAPAPGSYNAAPSPGSYNAAPAKY